jgi:tol-pal system protein YbgF
MRIATQIQLRRRILEMMLVGALLPAFGCVTVAEFRKLERVVIDMQRAQAPGASGGPARVADLSAQLADVRAELERLEGRVEVSEHRAGEALSEAQAARAASAAVPGAGEGPLDALAGGAAPASADGGASVVEAGEVEAYRGAYDAWREGEPEMCVDRFRNFLQTYPASAYADDATYWMADCYFKQGDYKTAVLRYDDVVSRYPTGNKAADALYRQGEALLRLGPGYGKAAGKAFERVLKEYPDSGRATEAKRQLDLLGTG